MTAWLIKINIIDDKNSQIRFPFEVPSRCGMMEPKHENFAGAANAKTTIREKTRNEADPNWGDDFKYQYI